MIKFDLKWLTQTWGIVDQCLAVIMHEPCHFIFIMIIILVMELTSTSVLLMCYSITARTDQSDSIEFFRYPSSTLLYRKLEIIQVHTCVHL